MGNVLIGLKGLLASKKGTLSLIVLAVSAALVAFGRLDGVAWAASTTLISTVYCWTASHVDRAAIEFGPRSS